MSPFINTKKNKGEKNSLLLVLQYFTHKVIEKVVFREYNTKL